MKKIKDNRRGSTLVEVIVTFALIGMFLLAATTAVSAAMNAFYRMESLSRASEASGDGKGRFSLYYYPVKDSSSQGTDWTFDENFYQGFWIEDLLFRWNGTEEEPDNIIEVRLTLTNGNTSYSQTRFVQCTNFFRPSHFSRIHTGVTF